ncbi:hypothetical protein FQN49_000029 [Arthroderma sp. PD_2]|nr:hypothetical protein FQN49_000029 [Arthroderma sp. PD_2]
MKSTSLVSVVLALAIPALAFDTSAIHNARVSAAESDRFHSKFSAATAGGPEAAISNVSSAGAQAAERATAIITELKVESKNSNEECTELSEELKDVKPASLSSLYAVLTRVQLFRATTTFTQDATHPLIFCSKNIDRLGPGIALNLNTVRMGIELSPTTLKRDCEDGEKLVAGIKGDYNTAVEAINKAFKQLNRPQGMCTQ